MTVAVVEARRPVYDDEHEALRESFARFLAEHPSGSLRDALGAAAQHGFVAASVPERDGGLGLDDPRFGSVLVEEAMRAGDAALAIGLGDHNDVCVPLLARHGDGALRRSVGPSLAAGELIVSLAGADAPAVAERESGGWRLRGSDAHVVNGVAAGVILVAATTPDEAAPAIFAVAADAPGVERAPADEVLGLPSLDLAATSFDVEVADRARIGGEDTWEWARGARALSLAVAGVAGARHAVKLASDYVRDRRVFGRPLATFENTRVLLGDVHGELLATEALVDAALVGHAERRLAPTVAAAAKLRATELLGHAVDVGVQLHGGYGYMAEYPISQAYAAARFFRVHGGASEAMKRMLADALGI